MRTAYKRIQVGINNRVNTYVVLPSLSKWIGAAHAIISYAVSHLQMPYNYHILPVLPWEPLSSIKPFSDGGWDQKFCKEKLYWDFLVEAVA